MREWQQFLQARNLHEVEDAGIQSGPSILFPTRFKQLVTEVWEHLKSVVPEYACPAPNRFVVLDKLPLNPVSVDLKSLAFYASSSIG